MLSRAFCEHHTYESFFPVRTKLADVIHSTPTTKTWPERGASALKRIKTKSRNKISQKMLNCHLQVSINGPQPGTQKTFEVIKKANEKWLAAKPCRKLPKKVISVLVKDKSVQADMPEVGNYLNVNEELYSWKNTKRTRQSTPEESIVECEHQSSVEETELAKHQLGEAEAAFGLPTNFECIQTRMTVA